MKYYKLLTQDLKSHNNTQWELNKPITVNIPGNSMCSNQVLHCYNHPLLAVILNPIHAAFSDPRLFEIEVDEIVNNDGLKFASKSQTLIKELELPKISTEQRIEFGIRVAKLVCKDEQWNSWADNWLDGKDRSRESASAVSSNAYYAKNFAAYYAAYAAAYSTYISDYTAYTSDYAADAYDSADAAEFNEKIIDIAENIVKVTY